MVDIKPELQLYDRVANTKVINDERYNVNTYVSIQSRVNNDDKFEEEYFKKIVRDGWVKLKKNEDIFIYPKGRLFKYRLNGKSMSKAQYGTFRSGGWLVGRNDNEKDPEIYNKYILYKAFNGVIFPLQLKDILEIYILSPDKERSTFKVPFTVTNFPVYLKDPYTDEQKIVYYARDKSNYLRFVNSKKYKKAVISGKWSWSAAFSM